MRSEHYDAIIVGSGFGGSAAAHSLSEAGLKVLLLERGGWAKRDDLDWNQREILIDQRYKGGSPIFVKQYNDRAFKPVYPNETVGGMSVFYGGASLRLRESDFAGWPIGYADLEGFYGRSERLLEVHGEAGGDACEPARTEGYPFESTELTPPARRIHDAACKLGYRPFRIPLAINFKNASRTTCIKCITCDGFPCKIEAKNDLTTTVLREAQALGAEVMPGVIVRRLDEENGRITSVACVDTDSGRAFDLSAGIVILSAGAVGSPAVLLRSNLEKCEGRRLIGRFLMRHCNAVVAGIFPFRTNPEDIFHKQVCLTDFYEDFREASGRAAGVIQDIYTPSPEVLRHFAPRGLKNAAAFLAGFMQNLLCIAEDEPDFENSVGLSRETDVYGMEIPRVTHRYSRGDYERRDYLVKRAKKVLRKAGGWITNVYEIDTFSHAVGTLRFGDNPEESVLDENCRFWGVDNLFVLDGSFMPTSGGVNPSLTIAANALRVADTIVKHGG